MDRQTGTGDGKWSEMKVKCLEIPVLSPSLCSVLSLALPAVPLIAIITFASCLHLNFSSLQSTLPQPPPLPDRLASVTLVQLQLGWTLGSSSHRQFPRGNAL